MKKMTSKSLQGRDSKELSAAPTTAIAELIPKSKDLSISNAVNSPNVLKLLKDYGEEMTKAAVIAVVVDGLEAINVKHPITDRQIEIFAEDFMEIRKTDSLDDLCMMFKLLRQNKLINTYQTLDVPTLHRAWDEYTEIKWEEKEKQIKKGKEFIHNNIYERAVLLTSKMPRKEPNQTPVWDAESATDDEVRLMIKYPSTSENLRAAMNQMKIRKLK